MTVETFTAPSVYTVGGAGPYATVFPYLASADVVVVVRDLDDNEVTLSPSDYTITGGLGSPGNVTLGAVAAAAHAGRPLLIRRATETEQGWSGYGSATGRAQEAQLDRNVMAIQDLGARGADRDATLARTLRVRPTETALPFLPPAAERAGRYMIWSQDGAQVLMTDGTPVAQTPGGTIFQTYAAAELADVPVIAQLIETQGYADAGDGGGARWRRRATEPSHPGKLQSADGAWWEIVGDTISPAQFGADLASPTSDDTAAFQACLDCAVATGAEVRWTGTVGLHDDVEIAAPVTVSCPRKYGRLLFFAGCTLRWRIGDGTGLSVSGPRFRGLLFEDAQDGAPWHAAPMIEGWSSSLVTFEDCDLDGRDRREYGIWVGRGRTVWASRFTGNRVSYCRVGLVMGESGDATHVLFAGNTIDHHKKAGAIFCQPTNGWIGSNSFEWNEGKIGCAIVSGQGGAAVNALSPTVWGNYIFNNAIDQSGAADSCGLLIGHDVPDTPFTSTRAVWGARVEQNYIVSDHTTRAVKAWVVENSVIRHNILVVHSGSSYEIEIGKAGQSWGAVDVDLNKPQNDPPPERILLVGTGRIRKPVLLDGDQVALAATDVIRLGVDTTLTGVGLTLDHDATGTTNLTTVRRGEITLSTDTDGGYSVAAAKAVTGNAGDGAWGDVFDIAADLPGATDTGFAKLLVAITQTTGNTQEAVYEIRVWTDLDDTLDDAAVAAGYEIVFRRPSTLYGGEQWRVSGTKLQHQRTLGWQSSAHVLGVAKMFGAP